MNILVLSWRDPKHPQAGGAEQVMHEHMKGWIAAGHDVTLFTSHFKEAKRKEKLDNVKIIRRGYQLLGVHTAAFFWYLFGNHNKYDIVVDQFHGIPFFTPLYVRVKKIAVLQEVAGKVWLTSEVPKPFNWILGIIGYLSEPIVFLFYIRIPFITGSRSAVDDLVKMHIPEKNIHIIHHGVKIVKPKSSIKKNTKKTIIFLGILTKDKGIEDALKTFSLLKEKGDYRFWVVGKKVPGYFTRIEGLTGELNIKEDVKFWGFVSQEKKFELLAKSHILINPSILEGWGLVNIEANSMGTPVVAYKSKGLIDSVKPSVNGSLVNQNNPEELAGEIHALLGNKLLYERMQKSSINWSNKFSWEKSKKLSLDLINMVVREG